MFEDETPHGVIRLPDLNLVAADTIRTAFDTGKNERTWSLLEALASAETITILDKQPTSYLVDLIERWGTHSGISIGELFDLTKIIKRHGLALEADLIDKGLRLRNCPNVDFDWHDLKVIVAYSSVHSRLYSAWQPDAAGWDTQTMLLAFIADLLNWRNWTLTPEGSKNRNRPKPIPRPGVKAPRSEGSRPQASKLSDIRKRLAARYAKARRPLDG